MSEKTKILYIIFFILICLFLSNISNADSNYHIFNDDLYSDPVFKKFLNQIDYSKNYNYEYNKLKLYPLSIAIYRVKSYDDFYRVANYFHLKIDTLASVNNLYSIYLFKGIKQVFIPNIDGMFIVYDGKTDLEKKYKIDLKNLLIVNRKKVFKKGDNIFIPFLEFSRKNKIFFLGSIFIDPLRGNGKVSSLFGYRIDPINGHRAFHGGIDLACPIGTKVFPAFYGKVIFTGWKGNYGNLVILQHEYGYQTYYGHLSKILVKRGQKVDLNTVLALSGKTGRTTGPHLHFEIRHNGSRINPDLFVNFGGF